MPLGAICVSPCSTSTSSKGTPSRSATIWLHAVSWPWPCGEAPVMTSTLPVASIRMLALLPAAGAVVERAEDAGRREAAHLGERRDADAELDRVVALAALLLLGAQLVVAEELLGLGRGGLVVARVVGHARHRGERELVVRDPVLLADLERVDARPRRRARPSAARWRRSPRGGRRRGRRRPTSCW